MSTDATVPTRRRYRAHDFTQADFDLAVEEGLFVLVEEGRYDLPDEVYEEANERRAP